MDRLLAIFQAVVQDGAQQQQVPFTALLTSQIACLTTLGLIAATNTANAVGGLFTGGLSAMAGHSAELDPLAMPRYRCMVNLETAKAVAKSVDFDLPAHLADFSGV